MPTLLAINSSNDVLSAALHHNGNTAGDSESALPHSEHALPLITALLGAQSLKLKDCDAFAYGAGPGKFSALRLVCALAKSFSYALKKPLIAVPTFIALAQINYPDDDDGDDNDNKTIRCALPAHRHHIIAARCRRRNGNWQDDGYQIINTDSPPAVTDDTAHICGDGFIRYPQLVRDRTLTSTHPYPDAVAVVTVAAKFFAQKKFTDPITAQPLYVRDKVAQTTQERLAAKSAQSAQ